MLSIRMCSESERGGVAFCVFRCESLEEDELNNGNRDKVEMVKSN